MAALPSLVFLAFTSTRDQKYRGWASFRDSVGAGRPLGETVPVAAPRRPADHGFVELSSVGIWRLLASNNRELARSWVAYPSYAAARDDVSRLQAAVDSLVVTVVRGESASQYGWLATLDGEPVISSGRWFGASSTSMHSALTTLADFALATISEAPARPADRRVRALSDAGAPW
ncbi:hypothetical protein GCM10027413_28040 [Conyzicola nivalis]|uniref:Uncharacterized protein n=1 Tax=Conyzicola nivalis TaxID=1477021 RepID=A0A916SSA5_9MICO|nr:hypothetical protein [Conyzicola nivalis]GGB14600.1 hypothetical protein GCM10010979_31470 [Conyzicola nivalis]